MIDAIALAFPLKTVVISSCVLGCPVTPEAMTYFIPDMK